METEWWLELENSYTERIAERKGLFDKYGKLVLNYLPGSELGCKEIMEHALQFLCAGQRPCSSSVVSLPET